MKLELRIIKASLYAGLTDIILGIIAVLTGFSDWYFEHFHFFGVVGMSLVFYALYHYILLKRDNNGRPH